MMKKPTHLSVRGVRKAFRGVQVLNDVSYDFEQGRKYVLLGANGCGKTTLLNLISGLSRPDSGEIVFKGQTYRRQSVEELAQSGIARTFQSVKVFRSMSVAENLLTAMQSKPDDRFLGALFAPLSMCSRPWTARVHEVLSEVRLQDKHALRPDQLSFGELKLLHFAMATVNPFDMLLLDEPVAGLQPKYVEEMLARLNRIEKTLIVVEHHGDFVRRLEAETLYLADGRVIASGSYDAVINEPEVRRRYL